MYKIHNKITMMLKWDKQCYLGLAVTESQILRGIFKTSYQRACHSIRRSLCLLHF